MQRITFYFILLATACCWTACRPQQTPLEAALEAAGTNRPELEKVLAHYQGDSLKLRAAAFLIENMPYHYAYSGKELRKYHAYFERFAASAWRGG